MDTHYGTLDEVELCEFEALLDLPDNDLWDMIARNDAANGNLEPVLRLLQSV
jgi:antitoxin CptB